MDYDKVNASSLTNCLREVHADGLMVSALNSRLSSQGSSPGQGHYVVFLGKTLYSHTEAQPRCIINKYQ